MMNSASLVHLLAGFSVHSVGLFVGNDIAYTPSPVCSQGGTPLDFEKYRSEDDTQYTVWCAADDTVPTNVVLDLREPSVVTGIGEHQSIRCGKLSMGSVASIAAGLDMIFQNMHLCPIFVALPNSFLLSTGFASLPNSFFLSKGFASTAKRHDRLQVRRFIRRHIYATP
jgi:hypothetical protein